MSEPLDHLYRLANRGAGGGASGGERRANAIVTCLMEHAHGIDETAMAGIKSLLIAIENRHFDVTDRFSDIPMRDSE